MPATRQTHRFERPLLFRIKWNQYNRDGLVSFDQLGLKSHLVRFHVSHRLHMTKCIHFRRRNDFSRQRRMKGVVNLGRTENRTGTKSFPERRLLTWENSHSTFALDWDASNHLDK